MILEMRRRRRIRGSRKNVELSCHTGAHSEPHSSDPDIVDCPTQLICNGFWFVFHDIAKRTQWENFLIHMPLTYEWGQHWFTHKDLASSARCYWPGILLFHHHPIWQTSGASPHLSPNTAIYNNPFIVVTEIGWLQLIIAVHKNPNTRFRSSYAICVSYDDNNDDNVDD